MRTETTPPRAATPTPLGVAPRVVAVMGSYRKGGTIDTLVGEILDAARERGAQTRQIDLIDEPIEYCRNCRACCRQPGTARATCVVDDGVAAILDALDDADAIVLAAPVNFGDVNALTRTLLERMLVYSYWPAGAAAPKLRSSMQHGARRRKPALLVTSSAAPGVLTRLFARPLRTLKQMAKLVGARPARPLVAGLAGQPGGPSAATRRKARALGALLVSDAPVA